MSLCPHHGHATVRRMVLCMKDNVRTTSDELVTMALVGEKKYAVFDDVESIPGQCSAT